MFRRYAVWVIIFFAFLIRLIFVLTVTNPPQKDAFEYDTMALNILDHKGFVDDTGAPSAFTPPLYPLFLSAIYFIFGHNYFVVQLLQAFLGAFTCLLIYLLATIIFNKQMGLISSIIAAIYPAFIFFYYGPAYLVTETLFLFLVYSSLLLIVYSFINLSPVIACCSGAMIGLATLTRPSSLFFPAVIFVWALATKVGLKKIARVFIPFCLFFLLVLSPWIIRNYKVFHTFVPGTTEGGITFYSSYSEGARGLGEGWHKALTEDEDLKKAGMNESVRSKIFFSRGLSYLKSHPKRFYFIFFRNLEQFWDISYDGLQGGPSRYNISLVFLLPLALLGVLWGLRSQRREFVLLLVMLIVYFSLLHAVFMGAFRYRVIVEPAIVILGAAGFFWLFRKINNLRCFILVFLSYLAIHLLIYIHYKNIFNFISGILKAVNLH